MTRSFSKAALSLATALAAGCFIRVDIYTDAGAGSASGTGGAGGSGGACTPGETRPCYDGPEGTEGKGICKAGVQTCFPDGSSWFSCSGAVKPAVENCATPEDEDCDGEAPACTGVALWSKSYGDASYQVALGVAMDPSDNVLITGYFDGILDFGLGQPLVGSGSADMFIAKLDPNGSPLWSKRFGDAADQVGQHIAVDKAGNVFVVGYFEGTMDFGLGPLTSEGGSDLFVVKLDPSGAPLWGKRFGDAGDQLAQEIAIDDAGNALVAGHFKGTVDFGLGPLTSTEGNDVFVVKLDPSGAPLWNKRFGGPGDQQAHGIAVDGLNNVSITGYFDGTIDFGSGPFPEAGNKDMFVAKLGSDGALIWAKRFGDGSSQLAQSIAADISGNTFVTGLFGGTIDLGSGISLSTKGGVELFVVKFDPLGSPVWGERFGIVDQLGQSTSVGLSVAVDHQGNATIAGYFEGDIDLGEGPIASAGGQDVLAIKLGSDGAVIWGKHFGDSSSGQKAQGCAIDKEDNVLLTGFFNGEIDFGSGPLVSAGGNDIFVTKLGP